MRARAALAIVLSAGCGAPGVPIDAPAAPRVPTFADDVAALVHRECSGCHREGGSGPFVLDDHASVARRRSQLLEVVESGLMPPWPPVEGYGKLADERVLTDDEKQLLRRWVAAGAPEGDPARTPAAPTFAGGWQLGEPDLVLEMDEAFVVPADGYDRWQCFVLPTELAEDRVVRAVELRPSNRRVVHHLIAYGLRDGSGADSLGAGFEGMCVDHLAVDDMLGGWAPGLQPIALPDGLGFRLPAGAAVVVDAHFQPTGRVEEERSRIGLTFANAAVERELTLLWLGAKGMCIPPGTREYRVRDRFELPVDTEVTAVLPHAHQVCREVRAWAELPDGSTEPLIWIDDWDFDWQGQYPLAEPLHLPRGSVIACEYVFDNSARPANPFDPPRRIIGGSRSIDEMASFYVQVVVDDADALAELRAAQALHVGAVEARTAHLETWTTYVVQQFDRDGDLSLDATEESAANAFVDALWSTRHDWLEAFDVNGDGALDEAEEARLREGIAAWRGER